MSTATVIFSAPGEGRSLDILGAPALYKAATADTGGRFSVMEQAVPPGYGVPMHRHADEDEALYVVDGEIVVDCGQGPRRATAGTLLFAPRGSFHTFRNESAAPARLLVICSPGNRLEACFTEFDTAARATPLTPADIGAITARHGIEIAA
ncbi:MAG: cupin domain-containing protein [Alphaproteobacteria bacterium]|nr:cupin domain-containing protein [Alphaproteobacteria bacterium]